MYEITVAPSLRPHGTILNKLRNIDRYVFTQFVHVLRHSEAYNNEAWTKLTIEMWSKIFDIVATIRVAKSGFYGFCRTRLFSDFPPNLLSFPPNFLSLGM